MKIKYKNILAVSLILVIIALIMVIVSFSNNEVIGINELQCEINICTLDYYATDYTYDSEQKICRCFNSAGVKTSETKMI